MHVCEHVSMHVWMYACVYVCEGLYTRVHECLYREENDRDIPTLLPHCWGCKSVGRSWLKAETWGLRSELQSALFSKPFRSLAMNRANSSLESEKQLLCRPGLWRTEQAAAWPLMIGVTHRVGLVWQRGSGACPKGL